MEASNCRRFKVGRPWLKDGQNGTTGEHWFASASKGLFLTLDFIT